MVDGHNWNQLHRVLLRRGYQQIIAQVDDIISYLDQRKGKRLEIIKSNDMSCVYLEKILGRIEITYEEFKSEYVQAYAVQ